jgi:DNA-binding transcriptional MerR regulator
MAEELISKKEVLRLTGISYGQLYRWKRKGLIPEAWFIRKATPTGQETFFPKERILERIRRIQELKEERSLDELVALLSPEARPEAIRWDDPTSLSPIGEEGRVLLWKDGGYTFPELFALACGAEAVRKGARPGEARLLVDLLKGAPDVLKSPSGILCVLAEKEVTGEGLSLRVAFAVLGREPLRLDPGCRVRVRLDLEKILEGLKLSLGEVS